MKQADVQQNICVIKFSVLTVFSVKIYEQLSAVFKGNTVTTQSTWMV
jgi:hypothetical protein